MSIYNPVSIIAEQNGYRQFLTQIAVTTSSAAYTLPTTIPNGMLLSNNCMLVLQGTVNFNYDLTDANGAISTTSALATGTITISGGSGIEEVYINGVSSS